MRYMNLPKFSVKYPVTVAMLMAAIAILGYISFTRLGTDLLPSIYNPRIVVEVLAGDRSPQEMEERFCRRLEGEVGTISRVVDVRSICSLGRVLTTVTFSWGTDMDFALLDVQKKVATFESEPEVDRVIIARYDPQEEPISIYALQSRAGMERDLDELRRIAENVVKRNLERLEGVARVQVFGGIRREVQVELDAYRLQAYSLTAQTVIQQVQQANANASGGRLVQDDRAYLIKGIGKFASVDEVGGTVVGYQLPAGGSNGDSTALGARQRGTMYAPDRVPIYLRDVAEVRYAPKERTEVVHFNGEPAVGLYVYKEARDNTVRVAGAVAEAMARMGSELQGLDHALVYSQATFIEEAVGEVKTTAVIGIILAILVLYFFLRHLGVTVIVSVAIPISILATFSLMYFQQYTLNVMTLGGLALGAGMLVDNAIVVIENIFRRRQLGEAPHQAAIAGTGEVGVAIIASTLTTVVVFLPIVYVQGVAAELFREQAWVVAFSLLSSLLVAFLLIPTLAARLFSRSTTIREQRLELPAYNRLLRWALGHRGVVLLAALLLLASAAVLLPVVGSEFVPHSSENQVQLRLSLPAGTPLERTEQVVAGAETQVQSLLGDRLENLYSSINVSTTQELFAGGTEQGEHRAVVTASLRRGEQGISPSAAIELLRTNLDLPETGIAYIIRETSLQQTIGTGGPPIVVEIRGDDLETLQQVSGRIADALRQTPGLHAVESSLQAGRPEMHIRVNRLLAANMGLDIQQIGERVQQRLAGNVATTFYAEGEDRDIRIAFPKATLAELSDMLITSPDGAMLRLRDLADLERKEGPKEIQRHNQSRIAHVSARLDDDERLSQAIRRVDATLAQVPLPAGYQLRFGGEEAERQASFDQLKFALFLSIVLVYMVLASLFESYLHPFTILLTLPLAGVGVVYAFLLVGEPLSVMAYIGIIMLGGIAANDSIILVDYINRLRQDGMARREAIIQAGKDRLRPILMTSATTILALLPLTIGLGEGARLRAPMAIAVIGGLVTSTLLTLVVIPVVYEVLDRLRRSGNDVPVVKN